MIKKLDSVAKGFVAAGGVAVTAMAPFYGKDHWFVIATAVYTALSVYFVRNS